MRKFSKVASLALMLSIGCTTAYAFPKIIVSDKGGIIDRYTIDNPYKEFSAQPNVREKGTPFPYEKYLADPNKKVEIIETYEPINDTDMESN